MENSFNEICNLIATDLEDVIQVSDRIKYINELRRVIHENFSPLKHHPIDFVQWLPFDDVSANDYNPNAVALQEMGLLHTSIAADGYTQPIVTVANPDAEPELKVVIVDGFHRNFVGKNFVDVAVSVKGHLPAVVQTGKSISDRMASTVRHNRARGKHSTDGMSNMVFALCDDGWSDEEICNKLGMEPEELLKLKHITGFSKLFENVEYKRAWETKNQILLRKAAAEKASDAPDGK